MSKQQKRSKKKPIIIAFIVIVGLALLTTGGIFGLKAYDKHQEDKIYSVGETMHYPDFNVVVTKAEAKPVNLPIKNELVQQYGGLDKDENCDTFSKASSLINVKFNSSTPIQALPNGPSDYNLCIRRNDSRKAIKQYSETNRQLVVDYKITANESVSTSQVRVQLIPDSGRKLNEQVDSLNCNEFIDPSTFDFGDTRTSNTDCFKYIPYFESELGGNISKGLTRSGYLYTDVRNNESSTDFILSYFHKGVNNTRTVRIDLTKK